MSRPSLINTARSAAVWPRHCRTPASTRRTLNAAAGPPPGSRGRSNSGSCRSPHTARQASATAAPARPGPRLRSDFDVCVGVGHQVAVPLRIEQRRDEYRAGLSAAVVEQQRGHRLAKARADAPLPADFAAGAAIPPNMYLACDFEDLRQQWRVQLLRALLCHQRYCAVLPPMGIAGMPSLR